MKIDRLCFVVVLLALAVSASAVVPTGEVYLASVGRGPGSCVDSVCAQWRTSAWATNLSSTQTATVQIAFLRRGQANLSPTTVPVSLAPGESREFADIFADTFNLDGVFGALRFRSDIPVAVHGRIFDANVHTNKGTGTAGQFFPGVPLEAAIVNGKSTEIAGLAQDSGGVTRSNFGMVEVEGKSCTVLAELLNGAGVSQASKVYQVLPLESLQDAITVIGGPLGTNQRVRLTVTAGDGAVIGFGSRIDNTTGDPSTSEMTNASVAPATAWAGAWTGQWVNTTFGTTGGVSLTVTVNLDARTVNMVVQLSGNVFGGTAPPPETLSGTLSPLGFTINQQSANFGTLFVTIAPGGLITGQATNIPNPNVTGLTFFGYGNPQKMTIAYFMTLAGGSQAGGYVNLTKP